jgi:hypothetical protein
VRPQDLVQPAGAGMAGGADIPGVQMALGLAAAVYFLREQKRTGLGKAFGLSVGGLVAGTLLGSLVENWLRVDIVPLGVSAPGCLGPLWRTLLLGGSCAGLCLASLRLSCSWASWLGIRPSVIWQAWTRERGQGGSKPPTSLPHYKSWRAGSL